MQQLGCERGHASMRLADALVPATAEVLDADQVMTGDRRSSAWSDGVRVIRP
jgi:hypothetical protein